MPNGEEGVTIPGIEMKPDDREPNDADMEKNVRDFESQVKEAKQVGHPRSGIGGYDQSEEVRGIGWAIKQLFNRRRIRRGNWNGKNMWLELQIPDEHSKMTLPYIYIEYPEGHPAYPMGCRVPWLASQTDILAYDWETI